MQTASRFRHKTSIVLREIDLLQNRYERSVSLVDRHIQDDGLTQQGLSQILGVNPSSLSRYLNEIDGYTPMSSAGMGPLRILEQIEAVCTRPALYQIGRGALTPPATECSDDSADDQRFYENHRERIYQLFDQFEPACALASVGELVSQAVHGPRNYRSRMCSNTALVIHSPLQKLKRGQVSDMLLRLTVSRLRRIAHTGLYSRKFLNPSLQAACRNCIVNYSGTGLANAGFVLGNDRLLTEGLRLISRTLQVEQEPEDAFWQNCLRMLERMLAEGVQDGVLWSKYIANSVPQPRPITVFYALKAPYALSNVVSHWRLIAPDLVHDL